jgi:hypothetical protein
MRAKSREVKEALAYVVGFTVVAVPGTIFLISSELQVAGWKLAVLVIAEFAGGEALRSGVRLRHARG